MNAATIFIVISAVSLMTSSLRGAQGDKDEFQTEMKKSTSGRTFESIGRDKAGKIVHWEIWFDDAEGKRLLTLLKNPEGDIIEVNHYSYKADGNIKEEYDFTGAGDTRMHKVYEYDSDGHWKRTLVYDGTGKLRGNVNSKPEFFLYGDKRRNRTDKR